MNSVNLNHALGTNKIQATYITSTTHCWLHVDTQPLQGDSSLRDMGPVVLRDRLSTPSGKNLQHAVSTNGLKYTKSNNTP